MLDFVILFFAFFVGIALLVGVFELLSRIVVWWWDTNINEGLKGIITIAFWALVCTIIVVVVIL